LLPFCMTVNVAVLCALCSTLMLPFVDAASVFAEEHHAGPGHENCTIAPAHARTVTIKLPQHAAHAPILPSCARRPRTNRAAAIPGANPMGGGGVGSGTWARQRSLRPPEGRRPREPHRAECVGWRGGAWGGPERRGRAFTSFLTSVSDSSAIGGKVVQ